MSSKIEEIILRHSQRGMTELRKYTTDDYCHAAAREILSWSKGNIVLTTGFYVAGFAETDGPSGTMVMASVLHELGYHPVILTDKYCKNFFEPEDIEVVYMPLDADDEYCDEFLRKYNPVGMISFERCGINTKNDYANMREISIKDNTAPCDRVFELALGRIPTIGVGDGGNEIGMGNMADIISQKLSLTPARVKVGNLVIASVSNWGAYGMAACLEELTKDKLFPSYQSIYEFICRTVAIGSVDGVTHERVAHVDGYDASVEKEIIEALIADIR